MDALTKLHFASRYMTSNQWENYIQSEEYMWARARIEGYKGAYMDKLVAAGNRKVSEAWAVASDIADKVVSEELMSMPSEIKRPAREPLVRELAEQLLREQSMVPPTYRKKIVCDNCGPIMAPESYDEQTSSCPWCAK